MEIGLLINQVSVDLNRKSGVQNKIHNKTNFQTVEWDASTKSTNKVSKLEKGFEQSQEEFETCDSNVAAWELQIEELRTKIKKAKKRQEEIQKFDHEELAKEIRVGVDHVKWAQALGKEIDILNSNKSMIDCRLLPLKTKYERVKVAIYFQFILITHTVIV